MTRKSYNNPPPQNNPIGPWGFLVAVFIVLLVFGWLVWRSAHVYDRAWDATATPTPAQTPSDAKITKLAGAVNMSTEPVTKVSPTPSAWDVKGSLNFYHDLVFSNPTVTLGAVAPILIITGSDMTLILVSGTVSMDAKDGAVRYYGDVNQDDGARGLYDLLTLFMKTEGWPLKTGTGQYK